MKPLSDETILAVLKLASASGIEFAWPGYYTIGPDECLLGIRFPDELNAMFAEREARRLRERLAADATKD